VRDLDMADADRVQRRVGFGHLALLRIARRVAVP
jgi:hypothetical protein